MDTIEGEGMTEPSVTETHISLVVLLDDRAIKVLKPLRTDVLDHSTVALRGAACRQEVALNRRLAPDVYLGVAEVHDETGAVCEHLILMRRLPDDARLSRLVLGLGQGEAEVRAVAEAMARFHTTAGRGPELDVVATAAGLRERWEQDLLGARAFADRWLPATALDELAARLDTYLDGRAALFDERIQQGWIRDGHGDLLADDIFCLPDGPRIIDCLAFSDELRWGDVQADVAFLAMDLERLGRADLARVLLEEHARLLEDRPPGSLVHLYVAQRALVRAKVRALRAEQGDESAAAEAATILALAVEHLRQGEVRLVLVGGAPGTGTSSVARGLAEHLDARLLLSDQVRKQLAGVESTTVLGSQPDTGPYEPAAVARVYDELLARAEGHLRRGESVVLDASWGSADQRTRARAMADDACTRVTELCTVAPLAVCQERTARRLADHGDPSDATPEVAALLAERFAPWPEAAVVKTTGSKAQSLALARTLVDQAPPPSPG